MPSYEVCHKRSENDFIKSNCWNFYNSTWPLQKILSEATHCWRQSFHPWRHCWKSSSVRSCSTSVTALWMLLIISECPRGWFLIVRKKYSHGNRYGKCCGCRTTATFLDIKKLPHRQHIVTGHIVMISEAKHQQCLFECTELFS